MAKLIGTMVRTGKDEGTVIGMKLVPGKRSKPKPTAKRKRQTIKLPTALRNCQWGWQSGTPAMRFTDGKREAIFNFGSEAEAKDFLLNGLAHVYGGSLGPILRHQVEGTIQLFNAVMERAEETAEDIASDVAAAEVSNRIDEAA